MKIHEATEQAYKNGYEKGYEDGKPKWIHVTERLPEDICPVLVAFADCPVAMLGRYQDSKWWWEHNSIAFRNEVTHWMPLPEPPKQGE